ncbi:MAG TPA: AraC family transcriptional regulator [Myxococcota bacterium]|nr:AraC family transcriptional regulator [Myxococcota bacterium]
MLAGPPSVDQVARALGLSHRTLNRRLAAEGTSVKVLLEDVRCELGRQLLEETRMPLSEIAKTLQYSEPSAFSRAFKGWTGSTTPSECSAKAMRERPRGM